MGPFCISTLNPKFLNRLLQMYTLEKNNTSPLCVLCTLMPQIIALSKLTSTGIWYEKSTSWGQNSLLNQEFLRDFKDSTLMWFQFLRDMTCFYLSTEFYNQTCVPLSCAMFASHNTFLLMHYIKTKLPLLKVDISISGTCHHHIK